MWRNLSDNFRLKNAYKQFMSLNMILLTALHDQFTHNCNLIKTGLRIFVDDLMVVLLLRSDVGHKESYLNKIQNFFQ